MSAAVARWLFWVSTIAAGWVLVGYPAWLALLRPRGWRTDATYRPSVTIVVPGYRERETLPRKLEALADLDYPRERIEVLVPIDGDATLARLAAEAAPFAKVLFESERGGKAAGLARALEQATGDVVVMTDANNLLEPGALLAATRHFADPSIWGVAGRRGEIGSAYDRYEDAIRMLESRSGSVAAMSGEFMAVRREHAPRFRGDVVNDDFWLLCQLVRAGGRVVYDPAAGSVEPPPSLKGEIARRSRMGAGRTMALTALEGLPPAFLWRVVSHKVGRLGLPFALVGALVGAVTAGGRRPYRVAALAQLGFYAMGLLGIAGRAPAGRKGWAFRAAAQFLLGNGATGLGVIRALRRRQSTTWDPVD